MNAENNETVESLRARSGRNYLEEPTPEEAALTFATTASVDGVSYFISDTALRAFRCANKWHAKQQQPKCVGGCGVSVKKLGSICADCFSRNLGEVPIKQGGNDV